MLNAPHTPEMDTAQQGTHTPHSHLAQSESTLPNPSNIVIVWQPQEGPQTAFVKCPIYECFYGGARGGGKTDATLGEFAIHAQRYGQHAIGLMVRRTLVELKETIARSKEIYTPLGATYQDVEKTWTFPNGARLRFSYLENDKDAEGYMGHSYTRLYVEEIGNFPDPTPINKLRATLRSGHGVPCCFRATGNPGGPGHHWVRARYIDPAPLGWEILSEEFIDPFTKEKIIKQRIFIPATVKDNQYLGTDYVANLQMSGSPELVRAWLEGDWTVVQGAFFPEFGKKHIIEPFPIPEHWTKFRSFDWGSYHPFAVGWYAVSDGSIPPYPKNAIIKYREWYGCSGPNLGLKMMVPDVAKGIRQREFERIDYSVADPSIFKQDGGIPIAESFRLNGVIFRPADNNRIAGSEQVRLRLVGVDDKPLFYIFKTCAHTIRTFPMLQHDDKKPEDVDTDGEDHCFTAETLVETDKGPIAIERLVGTSGKVLSLDGKYHDYFDCRLTKKKADLVKLTYASGKTITCTPDHQFLTLNGWKKAVDLYDEFSYAPALCKPSLGLNITNVVFIIREKVGDYIGLCGSIIMDQFLKAITYTTSITTATITTSPIYSFSQDATISVTMLNSLDEQPCPKLVLRKLLSGMGPKKDDNGIRSIGKITALKFLKERLKLRAITAVKNLNVWSPLSSALNSVMPTVRHERCVSVERLQKKADVYCLSVPGPFAFVVEGNISVSNCYDSDRYGLMSRPLTKFKKSPKTFNPDKVITFDELLKEYDRKKNSIRRRM